MIFRLLITITLVLTRVVVNSHCYWDSEPYKYFGAKTFYEDVSGDIRNAKKLTGCNPISLWILCRHGSRNPNVPNIVNMKNAMKLREDIVKLHAEGQGELCDKDVLNLQGWRWNETVESTPYFLISRGYRELKKFGSRINETFHDLLLHLPIHFIRAVDTQRNTESAKSFVGGLDPKLGYTLQKPLKEKEDLLLMPYINCERHRSESWDGPKQKYEKQKYLEGKDFQQLSESLQKRAGLLEPLTISNVSGLYDLCMYDRSFSETGRSPWCALFSTEDLQVMEYLEDLLNHFRRGYGIPINAKLGELVLNDLLQKFQSAVYGSQPSFTAFFPFDSLIEIVYGALGLYRDEEGLTAERRNPDRKWRASLNTPIMANIIAVLYNCPEERHNKKPYRVQFFANEKPLKICGESCTWDEFENKFQPFVNSSLDFCKIN